jgi:hypothetical protein
MNGNPKGNDRMPKWNEYIGMSSLSNLASAIE